MSSRQVKWPKETRSKEQQETFRAWSDLRNHEIERERLEISGLRASVKLGALYEQQRQGRSAEPYRPLGVFYRGFRTR